MRVSALAELLGVSEVTIRRDLEALERRGLLERTHGGAVLTHRLHVEPAYLEAISSNPEEKRRIGEAAARLIDDYGQGTVGERELGQRTDTIIGIKHDMIDLFPQVFGYDYYTVYSLLRLIDNALIDAPGDRISSGDKAVMNDLENARDLKRQLEGLLRAAPCGGGPSPSPTPSPS